MVGTTIALIAIAGAVSASHVAKAKIESNAAKKASQTQVAAGDKAANFMTQMWGQQQAQQQPYLQGGANAMNLLGAVMQPGGWKGQPYPTPNQPGLQNLPYGQQQGGPPVQQPPPGGRIPPPGTPTSGTAVPRPMPGAPPVSGMPPTPPGGANPQRQPYNYRSPQAQIWGQQAQGNNMPPMQQQAQLMNPWAVQ